MSIIFGTTNTDGSGSAQDLTEDTGIVISGTGETDGVNHVILGEGDFGLDFSTIEVDADEWNGVDNKEISIDESADYIRVDNFVDVEIINSAEDGFSHIEVLNVKRGLIDTSATDSDDSIVIGVNANNNHWSNEFEITTGEGNDTVLMTDVARSGYTDLDINTGEGNDTIDLADLHAAASSDQVRHVDGGTGLDVLVTNGDSVLQFEGIEVVEGQGFEQTQILNSDLIADNADLELGLVMTNISVEFDTDVSYEVADMSAAQAEYLDELGYDAEDFSLVSVSTADGDFSVLTDDASFA